MYRFDRRNENDDRIRVAPLIIEVGDTTIVDDETFDQKKLLELIKTSNTTAKSSCPSPDAYMEEMKGDEDIFVVTISANLSGSYNSAVLAKQLYIEKYGEKTSRLLILVVLLLGRLNNYETNGISKDRSKFQ